MTSLPKKLISGQALILVVLGMAVVLTVVLSAVSTSITDIGVTTRGEESIRALNAAEAGVEQAFLIADDSDGTLANDASFDAAVTGVAKSEVFYNTPRSLFSRQTVQARYLTVTELTLMFQVVLQKHIQFLRFVTV